MQLLARQCIAVNARDSRLLLVLFIALLVPTSPGHAFVCQRAISASIFTVFT
jgi:hypothetical protein